MRWFAFAIVVVIGLTAQTALAPRVAVYSVRPDWLLVLVVFLALYVPTKPAVIGAWIIGISADLMTVERMGFIALSYGLTALAILSIRDHLFRNHWTAQLIVTFVACVMVRGAWMIYQRTMFEHSTGWASSVMIDVMLVSIYTALWAPLIHGLLHRMARPLGLVMPRYSYAGLSRSGSTRV